MELLHGFKTMPVSATILDGVKVKAYSNKQPKRGQPRAHTEQYNKAAAKGYVFCNWLSHGHGTDSEPDMLMVRPSKALKDEFNKLIGYKITAIMPNSNINQNLFGIRIAEETGIGSYIASTVTKADFEKFKNAAPEFTV